MEIWSIVLVLVGLVTMTTGAPVTNMDEAQAYLRRYNYGGPGHPNPSMRDLKRQNTRKMALEHFQRFMGLPVTGTLDEDTMKKMSESRCGVEDVIHSRDIVRRRKRYATGDFRWGTTDISYKFVNQSSYSEDLRDNDVERIMKQALEMWSAVTPLTFRQVSPSAPAVIDILFGRGAHGTDNAPFDGPSGVLAHAYLPSQDRLGGDAHFDEDETFTDGTDSGTNLLFVAVHEFGHSLGLLHSDVPGAIMFPTYSGYRADLRLHADDISGIRHLYGSTTTTTRAPTKAQPTVSPTGPNAAPSSGMCNSGRVDAMGILRGFTYVFQGEDYARLIPQHGLAPDYPRPISDDWPGLTGPVDALLDTAHEDHVLIFKGDQVYNFTQSFSSFKFTLVSGFPRYINETIRDLPNNVDMALWWGATGISYIFKGDQYYRLTRNRTAVKRSYPRSVNMWNFPASLNLTAAFTAQNQRTYFFYGNEYLRYSDTEMKPESDGPLQTSTMWFGCEVADSASMEMMDVGPIPDVTPPDVNSAPAVGVMWGVILAVVMEMGIILGSVCV